MARKTNQIGSFTLLPIQNQHPPYWRKSLYLLTPLGFPGPTAFVEVATSKEPGLIGYQGHGGPRKKRLREAPGGLSCPYLPGCARCVGMGVLREVKSQNERLGASILNFHSAV